MLYKIHNGLVSTEPPPDWMPTNRDRLADTSWVADPARAAQLAGAIWLPAEDQTPPLGENQVYDGAETLSPDLERNVVVVVRGIRDMTPEELRGPVPTSCTPAQGLVALFAVKGITEDDLLAAIEQIPDEVQRYTAKIGFQRATSWERGSPTMQAMAQLLGLTEADLDDLFEFAVTVTV